MEGVALKLSLHAFLSYILIFLTIQIAFAKGPATSGAIILRQTSGARTLGMGEAFVALADDVNALNFNPAGLAQIRNYELSIMYLNSLVDTWFGFIGYAHPWGGQVESQAGKKTIKSLRARRNRGTIAVGVSSLQAGKMVLHPEGNTVRAEEDYLANLGFGYTIWRGEEVEKGKHRARATSELRNEVSVGLGIKLVYSTLVQKYSAMAYAVDVGALGKFIVGKNRLQIGITGQNLGTKIRFEEEGDTLPLTVRAGASYQMDFKKEHRLTISAETVKPNDNGFRGSGGMEYWYREIFALRAGYKIGYDIDPFTCGVGFAWKNFQVDYGWGMLDTRMGDNHRVSFTVRF
jgi:hypothetical protein